MITLLVYRGLHKNIILLLLLMIIYVFIKQIFRAAQQVSPSPLPPQCWGGGGVEVALFSHMPWLWLWILSRED
jgi:hypothetical protein